MIEKLSKLWAGAIAYVALLVGAGLSVAGNVADTYRTRGGATDALDVILAGAWPVLVLLTIELFVSRRWSPERGFQVLRWAGCLAIGSMAMMVSWVHLHDLLDSRGQIIPVATGGPLAIDGMAIMATGLLLSTRGLRRLATMATGTPVLTQANAPVAYFAGDVDEGWMADVEAEHRERASRPGDDLFARLEQELGGDSTAAVPVIPVSGPPALARSNEVKPESVPATAVELFRAWLEAPATDRPTAGTMHALVAGAHEVSPRTARRWWTAWSRPVLDV
jgi:hypothetical protein